MAYRGICYPVKAGNKGLFSSKTDIDLIKGNIIQIIRTRRGQRVMLPQFGSRIPEFIHEPLDEITCSLLRFELIKAIQRWEPRIIRVQANIFFYLKSYRQNKNIVLEINREGGVLDWQD